MSIKLKYATVIDKKKTQPPVELDFEAQAGQYTSIVTSDMADQNYLADILLSRKYLKSGSLTIDNNTKVNKYYAKRHINLIKGSKARLPFLSVRQRMIFSLMFNKDFSVRAKSELIKNRYEWLSFKSAKQNKTDIEMRANVDKIISRFIEATSEIENNWIYEFRKQMVEFHEKKIRETYADMSEYNKVIIRDYTNLIEVNWSNQLYETFLESLWDKVYSFMDIASNCHCEFNAKSSKNKAIKKLHKELNFHQHQYIVKKYLKQIEVKINDLKKTIFSSGFILKTMRARVFTELAKSNKEERKKVAAELAKWRELTNDQHVEFVEKQEQIFFSNLLDESIQIKGKIVEMMHAYHQKILTNSLQKMDPNLYKSELERLKLNVKSIRFQALDWTDDLMQKLGISYDWKYFKSSQTRLNEIFFRILQMYYNKKHNVIFQNTFASLSREDSQKLLDVLTRLIELDPEMTIIFIENDYRNLPRLLSESYKYQNGILDKFDIKDDIQKNTEAYTDSIFFKYNKLQFKVNKGAAITVSGQKIKLKGEVNNSDSVVLLNPFFIKTNKKNSKNPIITYNIKGIKNNTFKDPWMHLGVNSVGNKIYYYSEDTERNIEIFIEEDSLIKTL
jgi:hypothetical protein